MASLSSSEPTPVPQKYFKVHESLGSWKSPLWQELIQPTLTTEEIRLVYD